MPWHVEKDSSCPASKPFAVIRERDGHKEGCHATREAANAQMRALYAAESGKGDQSMLNKRYDVELKAAGDDDPEGTIIAYASVFGTVDLVGDRVIKGAFTKSLRKWREVGDPIPIILDHQWGDVHAHIGVADPQDVKQTNHGLLGKARLDIHDNPVAAQTYKLLKRRSLKAFSFGYKVLQEELDEEGVNDLLELDLIEFGPTLKGAHPDAQLVGVKSAVEAAMVKNEDLRRRTDEAAMQVAMGGVKPDVHADRKADDPGFIDQVVDGIMVRFADLGILSEEQAKAVWSTAYVNDLPDSAFLYIAPGGSKDGDGKTTPRSLRYFPVKDANGKVDLPHVRNALARIPQAKIPDDAKSRATAAAERLLKEHGGKDVPIDDGEPDPPGERVGSGKRDDPLRRRTEEIALDLANGRDPRSHAPPKDPDPSVGGDPDTGKAGSDPEEDVKRGHAPNIVINFDGDFATSIADAVVARTGTTNASVTTTQVTTAKSDDTTEDESPAGPDEKELRQATREVVLEMALGQAIKSDPPPGDPDKVDPPPASNPEDTKQKSAPEPPKAEDFATAVVDKLKEVYSDDETGGRDPLRKKHDKQRLEQALGRKTNEVPEDTDGDEDAAGDEDEKAQTKKAPTPEEFAEAVAAKLEQRSKSEVEKPSDEKDASSKSGGRDPLRKRTERQALDLALGRSSQDVPDIAHPDPPPAPRELPDEKTLRRQSDQAALDLALGGFN